MKIAEISVEHILTKSKLPESAYCINPYVGCMHGCVYCYARFMRRFTKHTEPWGTFVDIKANSGEAMAKDLRRSPDRAAALLGSVTDAYQPLEKKHKVTRSTLTELVKHDFPISILTKSDLVLRDLDLLQRLTHCTVGFSISTLDERARRIFEPRAVSIARRLKAMRVLHDAGIETYAFIGPILPHITAIEPIFRAIEGAADTVWGEALNTRCGNWDDIVLAVEKFDPSLKQSFETAVRDKQYWARISEEFRSFSEAFKIPLVGFYRH